MRAAGSREPLRFVVVDNIDGRSASNSSVRRRRCAWRTGAPRPSTILAERHHDRTRGRQQAEADGTPTTHELIAGCARCASSRPGPWRPSCAMAGTSASTAPRQSRRRRFVPATWCMRSSPNVSESSRSCGRSKRASGAGRRHVLRRQQPTAVIREIAPGIKAVRGEGRPSKHLRRELERMRRAGRG